MISKSSPMPAYYQIKMRILDMIKQDMYEVGDKLPTDSEFCTQYGVSRITVRRALSELEQEGYIERIQGKGSYLKFKGLDQNIEKFYSFNDEIHKMGMVPSSIFLKLELIAADSTIADILKISEGDKVYLLERLRLANDIIIAYDRSYLPEYIVPGFNKNMISSGSMYDAMERHFDAKPTVAEESLEAISINEKDAMKMRLKPNSSQLLVKRLSYNKDRIVEYNYRIVNSSVYKYKFKLDKL